MSAGLLVLEIKGSFATRVLALGVETAEDDLSDLQRRLHDIAKLQNFQSNQHCRPKWANGAFVFLSLEHASEAEKAVAQDGFSLGKHHILCSPELEDLLGEAFASTPSTGHAEKDYQAQRSGTLKLVKEVPFAPLSRVHAQLAGACASTEQVGNNLLTVKHTFFSDFLHEGSESSRPTRSTGDRPLARLPAAAATLKGQERLPPREADYGSQRKNFHLKHIRAETSFTDGPKFFDYSKMSHGMPAIEAAGSETSFHTGFSGITDTFHDTEEKYESVCIEAEGWIRERLNARSWLAQSRDPVKESINDFVALMQFVFDKSHPSAETCTALYALEDEEARVSAVKQVWRSFEEQLAAHMPALLQFYKQDLRRDRPWTEFGKKLAEDLLKILKQNRRKSLNHFVRQHRLWNPVTAVFDEHPEGEALPLLGNHVLTLTREFLVACLANRVQRFAKSANKLSQGSSLAPVQQFDFVALTRIDEELPREVEQIIWRETVRRAAPKNEKGRRLIIGRAKRTSTFNFFSEYD